MALTGKARVNGWQHQATRLAINHATWGTTVMAVAEQARRRRAFQHEAQDSDAAARARHIALATALQLERAKTAGLERRAAQEAAATRALSGQLPALVSQFKAAEKRLVELESELRAARQALARRDSEQAQAQAAQSEAAAKRVLELESELNTAREALAHRDNENHSLRTSLDVALADNARLAQRPSASNAALDDARARLEFLEAALAAAEAECTRVAGESNAASERQQSELQSLNNQLANMSAHAVIAEKLVAETRACLLGRTAENNSLERRLAEAVAAGHEADKKLKRLAEALQSKQRQVDELEGSRVKLVEGANALLKTFQDRDVALVRAEENIKFLNKRIAQLEAQAELAEVWEPIDSLDLRPSGADEAREKARKNWAELARELTRLVKFSEQANGRSGSARLAGAVAL